MYTDTDTDIYNTYIYTPTLNLIFVLTRERTSFFICASSAFTRGANSAENVRPVKEREGLVVVSVSSKGAAGLGLGIAGALGALPVGVLWGGVM
jgi:hypothetical protein